MKKSKNIMVLSCEKASELIEKNVHFGLKPIEKVQLFVHNSMCDACRMWKKQSKDLDGALNKYIHLHPNERDLPTDSLTDEAKEKIVKKLEQIE